MHPYDLCRTSCAHAKQVLIQLSTLNVSLHISQFMHNHAEAMQMLQREVEDDDDDDEEDDEDEESEVSSIVENSVQLR